MIKFRAWLPSEGKFVYSDRVCYTGLNEIIKWTFNDEGSIEVGYESLSGSIYFTLTNKIDRFAGVFDTSGNEVYERDITDFGYVVTYVDGTKNEDLGMDVGFYEQRDDFESWGMIEGGHTYNVIGNLYQGILNK